MKRKEMKRRLKWMERRLDGMIYTVRRHDSQLDQMAAAARRDHDTGLSARVDESGDAAEKLRREVMERLEELENPRGQIGVWWRVAKLAELRRENP